MHLAIHTPMFGADGVESHAINCPKCGTSVSGADLEDAPIEECNAGQEFKCKCGQSLFINWGLVEPDHLSKWISFEHCHHWLCRVKAKIAEGKE